MCGGLYGCCCKSEDTLLQQKIEVSNSCRTLANDKGEESGLVEDEGVDA